eukprot:290051_1
MNQQKLINELQTNTQSAIFDEYVEQKNMNYRLNFKYNELFVNYGKLKIKDNFSTNVNQWSVEDVIIWIMHLDNGKYVKYKHAIIPSIINKQIDGLVLLKLDLCDIASIGITGFLDQQVLIKHIQVLIK